MEYRKTYCRNCSASCGLELLVEDNRIVDIRGDHDHPVSRGYMCIKGRYNAELHNGEDRLVSALKRDENGNFVPIDSLAAIEEAAGRLNELIAAYGPRSVAMYYGTGSCFNGLTYGMARTWLAGIGSPEHYSSFTVDQSAKWVCLGRMGLFATGKPMHEDVDVMLLAGINPVVSHLGYPLAPVPMTDSMKWMKEARARGAKLIVVDPRRTETARMADLHLQILPGEDATLYAAMIRVLFERCWTDTAFCERYVTSIDKLREAVADYSLDYAAKRTGLLGDQILEAAEMFGTAARQCAWSGTGPNMARHSNTSEHLLECLNALCGGYRRAGDPIKATGAIFNTVPTQETVVPPSRDWEGGPRLRTVDAGQLNAEFPTSRLPDEVLCDSEDRVRALVVCGGNPVSAIGDTARTVKAFEALDLLLVIDPRMSETARLADYIIPAKLPFERHDMTISQDNWFAWDFAHIAKPVMAPVEGMLDDWEVFWELGRLMNAPMDFRIGPYGVSLPRGRLDMSGPRPTSLEMLRTVCQDSRVQPDELMKHPSGMVISAGTIITAPEKDDGHRLDLCPPDVFTEIRAIRAEKLRDQEYSFLLISRRAVHVVNSSYQNAQKVKDRHPIAPLYMHPTQMTDGGFVEGEIAEIESSTGRVFGEVHKDAGLRSGVVSMPSNWGPASSSAQATSLTNRLVSLDEEIEAINFMPRQSGIPVNVRKTNWVDSTNTSNAPIGEAGGPG